MRRRRALSVESPLPRGRGARASAWDWALRVSAVAGVVPLWCARFLPFSDMPEQIAVISALRHWFDPAFRVQEHFTFALGKSQYLIYHVVGALLTLGVGSAELANQLLMTVVGLAYPFALLSLLRAMRRDERLALFGAPVFWSRPLVMGFLPYVASVPVLTWGLALTIRQVETPTRGRAVGLGALAVALFYLHANAYVLFVLAATALTFTMTVASGARAFARAVLALPWRLLWLAPSALLAASWVVYGTIANRAASLSDAGQVSYSPKDELVREFPSWAHDIWRSHVDEWCAVAFWGAMVLLVLGALRRRAPSGPAPEVEAERRFDRVAWVPFACAVVAYFALPYSVGAGVMLNLRIAVFVALFAPLLLRVAPGFWGAAPLLAVLSVSLVGSANAALEVSRAEDRELGALDRLLDRMEPGKRVLNLTFHVTSERMHWAPWTFVGAYHRIRHGGVASVSFSELAHWPLHYRPEAAPPLKAETFWTFDSCLYRNETDGPYYDYVLTRGNVAPFRDEPPGPRWRELDTERDWTLYQRIDGEESAKWSVEDGGPCESRRSLERLARDRDANGPKK